MTAASNHSKSERAENDFYSTDPEAINYLLKHETFNNNIWEPACGDGALSKRLEEFGYNVTSTDLVDRGYGVSGVDFLEQTTRFDGDIITNPPFKLSTDFILKALELTNDKVAFFLKMQFLEGKRRYEKIFSKYPPKKVLPFVKRINCYRNGDLDSIKSSFVFYCWTIWEKDYEGPTTLKWINNIEE